MYNTIKNNLDNPEGLEKLFQMNPKKFQTSFNEVFLEFPDSVICQVWWERLNYQSDDQPLLSSRSRRTSWDMPLVILLSFLAGTYAKLPAFFSGIDDHFFYPKNTPFFIFFALIAYFLYKRRSPRKIQFTVISSFFVSLLFMNSLPELNYSDTLTLAYIHMPFILWSILGFAYCGENFNNLSVRLNFLRYNGELLIYTALILVGGMILTALTLALFKLIDIKIIDWYMKNVVVYGAIASPIVATYIIVNITRNKLKIAPIVGKIFSPLLLITFIAYLIAMIAEGESPYANRDFLLVYNAMLLIVLATIIFVISERTDTSEWLNTDLNNLGLLIVVLILDLIALSAIGHRLKTYGLSPNKIIVLGANILILINLLGILYHYVRFFRKTIQFKTIEQWIAAFLPVYSFWSMFVVFIFPFLFSFE